MMVDKLMSSSSMDRFASLKSVGGHVLDLYRMATFNFTNPHSYTKFRVIDAVRKASGAKTFIESGTYMGVTARRCSKVFDRVLTIELSEELAAQAVRSLRDRPNIEVIQGDGVAELRRLLADASVRDVLVFLDGHFSGGITTQGEVPEPAIEELDILAEHRAKVRAIVIDDFRAFGKEPGFPTKGDLVAASEKHFGNHGYDIVAAVDQLIISQRRG